MSLPSPTIDERNLPQSSAEQGTIPRPEYPRPQFVREDWLNLNGVWEFRLDDDNVGLEQSWFSSDTFPGRILVPFSIESRKSASATGLSIAVCGTAVTSRFPPSGPASECY